MGVKDWLRSQSQACTKVIQFLLLYWGLMSLIEINESHWWQWETIKKKKVSPRDQHRYTVVQHILRTTQCMSLPLSTPLLLPPTFPSSLQPLPLSLPLSPLELSPLFLPAHPLSTSTLLSSCENSACVCVCVNSSRVCVKRSFMCVHRVVCFSKWRWSVAVHQWSWLQTGEYSDLTALPFNLHTGCLLDFFFKVSLDFFAPKWDSAAALFLPSRHHSHHWNYWRFFSVLEEFLCTSNIFLFILPIYGV